MIVISKDNKYFKIVHQPSIEIINKIANDNNYSLLMDIEKEQNNKKSCYNCIYNTLNSYDSEFVNKCTKINICSSDMKVDGFSCSFFKDYRLED